MNGHDFDLRAWARNPVNPVSTLMIWGGLLTAIATQAPAWIWVFGAGFFGPTLLRELGLMRWEEEFQREVALRAALHAMLAVGLLSTAVMAINGFGGTYNDEMKAFEDAMPASTVLILLALVWSLSRLIQYWGVRKAAFRIWCGVGLVWLGVVLIALMTLEPIREGMGPRRLLEMCLFWAPLLVLAWLAPRWPRWVGAAGLAYLGWILFGADMAQAFAGTMPWEMRLDMVLLTLAPVGAPAVALLASRKP